MINLPRLLTIMLFFVLSITSAKAAVCTNQTVADNFNSVSFSQNNGTTNWATDWLEMGESDGVNAGITRVRNDNCSSGNCLRIGVVSGNPAQTYTSIGVQREANLSGATSATLTFNYRTGYASGTPLVRLWVSNNGGASWIFLQQYSFFSSSFSDTPQSFDLTPYISSNTRIRFSGNGSAAVSGFYVDNININYTGTCVPATPSTEWRLDESSWNGTPNEIKDSIGSLDGTAFNASTVNGQVCKAADLSANSTSDYLSMDSAALNGATDFSISAWGKTSNTGSQALFSVSSGSQHNELIMWFPNSSTFTPFLKGNSSGSISISNIADNNWHHFLWTRNGTQNCFYLDGVLQGCSTKTNQALSVAAGGLIIGQEQDSLGGSFSGGQDWEGLVDEPLIFQSSLTQTEVSSIYNNQLAGNGWDGSARSCPSLIAEWRMNEPLWAGGAAEVNDATGNGHNGSAINDLTNTDTSPALTGNPGTCRYGEFDGVNDYINIAHDPKLSITDELTVTTWIRANQLPSAGLMTILSKDENFEFHLTPSGQINWWWQSSGGATNQIFTTETISTGVWHHIAIVYSQSTTTQQIYIDGVASASSLSLSQALATNTDPLQIGQDQFSSGRYFNGDIDEVQLYQGALSNVEINQIMNERRPCSGTPRAEWRFDEASWDGTANEVLDSGVNSFHGTAFNSTPTAGLVCNAADLSANSTTDYLSLNNGAFNGVGDFTLSLWANTSVGSGARAIVSGSSGFQHNELIMWFPNASTFQPFLKGSRSGGNISIPNMGDSQWHHYVWTRSGSQNCLYRDGVSQGCANRSTATLSIASGGLIIGQEQDSLGGSFAINQDWEGLIDEMILFDGALTVPEIQSIHNNNLAGNNWNGAPRSCSTALDHLSINHSGSALTCAAEPVDIAAHRSDHTVDTSYLKTVNLTTSTNHGDWSVISGNGTLNNGTVNDGVASYIFAATDSGNVQLGLANTTTEILNINVTDGSISETSGAALTTEDQDLNFKASGLRFLANSNPSAIGTQISGKNSNLTPGTQTLELQAIRTDSSGTCEAALVNSHPIELAYECVDPGTCSSTRVAIDGANIGANISGSVSNYLPVTLDFGDATDSTATFTLNYPDAGELRLHARYNIPNTGLVTGSSNDFVVKPAGLCVETTDTGSDCASGNHNCSRFKKAGESFNLRIKGVAWESSAGAESDANFCTGNSTTPNFQLDNITLFSTLIAPNPPLPAAPGTNATLGITSFNIGATDNGEHNVANQTASEVGVFTLTATPLSYLGQTLAASSSANIGRFYPDRFEVSATSITEACSTGNFSYLGQNFTALYTLTAKNTGTGTTANYRDNFIRLDPSISPPVAAPLNTLSFGAIDNSLPTLLSGRLPLLPTTSFTWNNDGTGTLISTLNLARLGTGSSNIDGPFTVQIGVLPTDADGVTVKLSNRNLDIDNDLTNDHVLVNTSIQRYGRLIIDNAFGPEVLDLKVPLRTEFWNGTAFVINGNDTACSGSLFSTPSFIFTDPVLTDSLTEASLSSKSYSPITSGSGSLTLGAPNTSGPLNISLSVPDWLKYDFNGDGNDESPIAQAFFGQYRGNDRIIFWREQFGP